MDHIYEKVKASSKFFKIIKEYANITGLATAAGANAGTNPTEPQDPKVITANKLKIDADKKAAQAELQALQAKSNVDKVSGPSDQQRMKNLRDIIAGKPIQVSTK